jgi:hypothetical protein
VRWGGLRGGKEDVVVAVLGRRSTTIGTEIDWLTDRIVYRLYGLTEEEIAVVEGKGA